MLVRTTIVIMACSLVFVVRGLFAANGPATDATDANDVNLMAFVGRRISVVEVENVVPEGHIPFDQKYVARYEVLDVIYGVYERAEIEFVAYDHYGYPGFAYWEVALLHVSEYEDDLIHQKYLYHPVFPTVSGRWAACGDLYNRRKGIDEEWLD